MAEMNAKEGKPGIPMFFNIGSLPCTSHLANARLPSDFMIGACRCVFGLIPRLDVLLGLSAQY